jgi:hypothetical protein
MKTILLGLLLFTGIVKAQIVNIPDANFKAKLLNYNPVIDTNSNGEIEVSEALSQTSLSIVSSNIINITGIEEFTNLTSLNCTNNLITTMNLTSLTNLTLLNVNNNLLTSLNVSGLSILNDFSCSNNQLQNLNIQGCINLNNFNCSNNNLTNIDLIATSLFIFNCNQNDLTTLNLNVNSISNFYCSGNLLTTLDLSDISFSQIDCSNNLLTSLNLSGTTISFELNCRINQLSSIDVSNLQFSNFICDNNQFTTLELSTCTNLFSLQCNENPLITLFVKNGRNEFISFSSGLQFICADESQISFIQSQTGPSVLVSSYCSFVPGGSYNTVSGTIRYDTNNNGCDATDFSISNVRVDVDNGIIQESIFTNNSGNFNFYTNAGSYTLTSNVENPTWFTFSPTTATIPFANSNNNTATQNFCISPNGVHHDLEVVLAPITPARPGFDAVYKIVYKNKGNQTLSGNVTFTYNDAVLDFVSATQTPTAQAIGSLSWSFTNLQPFENRSFYVTLNVNSPQETPAVNNDDQLDFNVTINPIAGDEIPADNLFNYKQIVVGSYDPNDITCLEGDTVSPSEIGNYLHYVINFENLGTFYAENVVVKTEIDPTKYDIATLQLLNTSHPSSTRITGNIVEFIFEDVNLAEAAGNPPVGGHGDVLFKIKTKDNLVTNDTVLQRAGIYFDYNFPVITNDAETTFAALNNPNFELDNSVKVYPNPSKGNVNINCNFNIKSIELYDVQGRILETNLVNDVSKTIDISTKQNGIYFIKITTEKGIKVEKIIKE